MGQVHAPGACAPCDQQISVASCEGDDKLDGCNQAIMFTEGFDTLDPKETKALLDAPAS